MNSTNLKPLGSVEFIMLMALITSITALSIDTVLPAFSFISDDLNLKQSKDSQLIIIILFFGMAFGQIFYGPLSDNIGRKPSIYIGFSLFLIGSLFSIFATELNTMLLGRFLQGLGVASPRIVTMAIVRDSYSGAQMARIMSLMLAIFITIPIVAPALGSFILLISSWRMIFVFAAVFALIVLIWFTLRQPETLNPQFKQPFNFGHIINNTVKVLKIRPVVLYSIMSGLIFGAFLAYLSAAQHIFQNIYDTGTLFPIYFAILAFSLGISSYLNSKWVLIVSPEKLTKIALQGIIILSTLTLVFIFINKSPLNLLQAMIYFSILYFLVGLLFGNINALAMQPLKKLAGIGAGIIGSLSTFIAIPLGYVIGKSLDTDINYFIVAFFICSLISLIIMRTLEKTKH